MVQSTFLEADANVAGTMTGITEVQLPVEDRMRKIEETEETKRRMLAGRRCGWRACTLGHSLGGNDIHTIWSTR